MESLIWASLSISMYLMDLKFHRFLNIFLYIWGWLGSVIIIRRLSLYFVVCSIFYSLIVQYLKLLTEFVMSSTFAELRPTSMKHSVQARGTILKCTLWDDFIGTFMDDYEAKKDTQTIVILQFGKLTKYKGLVKIQSRSFLTQIFINEDLPEINRFRERLNISIANGKCVADSSLVGDGVASRDILDDISLTTIEHLSTCKQGGTFWVSGKVVHIEDDGGWFYMACKKCARKVQEADNRFCCSKGNLTSDDMELRYKVVFHVAGDTTLALFMVWDRDCKKLIGKTAGELRSLHPEDPTLPGEFGEVFLGKQFFFKISIPIVVTTWFNRTFNVATISTDNVARSVHTISTSDKIASLTNSACAGSQSAGLCYPTSTPSASQSAIGDSSEFSSVDSLKRNLADAFSSTKDLKRAKDVIKVETP